MVWWVKIKLMLRWFQSCHWQWPQPVPLTSKRTNTSKWTCRMGSHGAKRVVMKRKDPPKRPFLHLDCLIIITMQKFAQRLLHLMPFFAWFISFNCSLKVDYFNVDRFLRSCQHSKFSNESNARALFVLLEIKRCWGMPLMLPAIGWGTYLLIRTLGNLQLQHKHETMQRIKFK